MILGVSDLKGDQFFARQGGGEAECYDDHESPQFSLFLLP